MSLTIPDDTHCPFCAYLADESDESDAVFVSRGAVVSVMLNPRQYERGALLVIPNRHTHSLIDAPDEQFVAVQFEARRMARALVKHLGATGVNVYQNAGVHAGQTVPHYHVHVVPRYPGSDPARRFREADYALTPAPDLRALADELNAPKNALLDSFESLFDRESHRTPKWNAALVAWTVMGLVALWRIISTAGVDGVGSSRAFLVFMSGSFAGTVAMSTKRRRTLLLGFGASILLFAIAAAMTWIGS